MKVLIADVLVPFEANRGEGLAAKLSGHLIQGGHEAEILRIPLDARSDAWVSQWMLLATLRITQVDRLIGVAAPMALIDHPCKVLWLDSPSGLDLVGEDAAMAERALLDAASGAHSVFARSQHARQWLGREGGIDAPILDQANTAWSSIAARLLA